ncbi:methyl-accepting chemotaxis protein [Vreelandella janggokensis]|uniref:Methyl-accepting chemotaxis protein n=1 Tax=Vreelandella janggokensis TaxID=370767 RepID=A0ABT4IYM7_9GAMM|nr:methyl-accepting chemotaxis protein [Halomonas janggokensis]MCZ0928776.1 methyl-accepting chemotaxis protein [Halomonas janggokensis]
MLEKLHKINVKYTLAFILVALSLLGVVVVDSLLVQSMRERITAFSGSFNPAVSAVLNADRDLYQARVAELEVLREAPGSEGASAQYDDYRENAEQAYDRMHDFLGLLEAYPQVSEGLEPFEDRYAAWEAASQRVFDLHADGELDAAEAQLEGDSLAAFNSLRELYNIAGESADARGLALEQETLAAVAVQQRWVMGFTALVLLVTLVIALMGPNLMSRALRQVSGRIRDITEGEGDLTARIDSQRRDEIGELAREFDGFIARMDVSFQAVRDGARNVNVASDEIASGSEDLASRTEEQASALQETASSMEEMSSIVRQNSESASNADTISSQAAEKAEKGVKEVQHSVELMRELETSSRKVGEIVEVIDSIAFQTNILALNASVEAARAGEHGRGFAVVASEVRNLASRSADSSNKIREMITDISQRIASGAEQAVRSGEGIQDTVEAIRQVSGLMNEISLAVREQESGIQQVGTALTQMDSATQQNVTLVSQTSGSAASLQQEANRLTRLVDAFKLSGDATGTASPSLPKPPASQQAPQRNTKRNEPEWEAF